MDLEFTVFELVEDCLADDFAGGEFIETRDVEQAEIEFCLGDSLEGRGVEGDGFGDGVRGDFGGDGGVAGQEAGCGGFAGAAAADY